MTDRDARDDAPGVESPHDRARRLVSAAWDGEITAAELRALAEHLGACDDCALAAASLRAFLGRLEDLLCDPGTREGPAPGRAGGPPSAP